MLESLRRRWISVMIVCMRRPCALWSLHLASHSPGPCLGVHIIELCVMGRWRLPLISLTAHKVFFFYCRSPPVWVETPKARHPRPPFMQYPEKCRRFSTNYHASTLWHCCRTHLAILRAWPIYPSHPDFRLYFHCFLLCRVLCGSFLDTFQLQGWE
jgi:hypothetical protein